MKKLAIILGLMLGINLYSASLCTIHITSEKFSGERIKVTFHTRLNSPEECSALAVLHQTNYQSQEIKKKQVVYVWGAGQEKKKKPSLASKKSRSRSRYR